MYCTTLFFRLILISRFSYLENLLHFDLADFPVNFMAMAIQKNCVYLIWRFYSNRENLMLANYTCFTVSGA